MKKDKKDIDINKIWHKGSRPNIPIEMKEFEKLFEKIKKIFPDAKINIGLKYYDNIIKSKLFESNIVFNNKNCRVFFDTDENEKLVFSLEIFDYTVYNEYTFGIQDYYDSKILLKKIKVLSKKTNSEILNDFRNLLNKLENIN
jgi:hypothetical protein